MWSPSSSRTCAAVASTSAAAEAAVAGRRPAADRARSGRRPLRRGRRSRRSGCRPGGAPRRAGRRLPTRRCRPAGTSGRRCPRRRRGSRRRGRTWSVQIGRISRGGPGRATISRPSGRLDPPARRRAVGVREGLRRWDEPRLLEVDLGHRHAAPRPEAAQPGLEVRIDGRRLAGDGGDRLTGEVVRRRPEAAGRDDEVRALERRRERGGDALEVVGQGLDPADRDPEPGQAAGEIAGVRVARLADRQLAADAEQLGGQRAVATEPSAERNRRYGVRLRAARAIRARYHRTNRYATFAPCRAVDMQADAPGTARLSASTDPAEVPSERDRAERVLRVRSLAGPRPADPRVARRGGRRRRPARAAAPTTSPIGRCRISRASRSGSSAGCGPMPPGIAELRYLLGRVGAGRVEPAVDRRPSGAPRPPRRRSSGIARHAAPGDRRLACAAPSRGISPRSPMPGSSSPSCRASRTRRSAIRRAGGRTPTSPRPADRPSWPAGSMSSSASCGGRRPAGRPTRAIRSSGAPTASSTRPTGSAWGRSAGRDLNGTRPVRPTVAGMIGRSPRRTHGSPPLDEPQPTAPRADTRSRPPEPEPRRAEQHAGPSRARSPPRPDEPPSLRAQIGATRDPRQAPRRLPTSSWPRPSSARSSTRSSGSRSSSGSPIGVGDRRRPPPHRRACRCSSVSGSSARSGWGLLHGLLLLAAIGVGRGRHGARRRGRRARPERRVGLAHGVVVGIVLGLNLTNRGLGRSSATRSCR